MTFEFWLYVTFNAHASLIWSKLKIVGKKSTFKNLMFIKKKLHSVTELGACVSVDHYATEKDTQSWQFLNISTMN